MWKLRSSSHAGLALCLALVSKGCGEAPEALPTEEALPPTESASLPPSFEPATVASALGKVKNLLTGLPVSDAEVLAVTQDPKALPRLIDGWMADPALTLRMLRFFGNAFQQLNLSGQSLIDQAPDLQPNGRLLANVQLSFPLTAWQLSFVEGRPFTEVLTTDRFMMTPPLATLLSFMDNRHTNDANRGTDYINTADPMFKITLSNKNGPIALEKSVTPGDPLFMNWYVSKPFPMNCADPQILSRDTVRLYQFLIGNVSPSGACPTGIPNDSQFADAEYDAWRMVRVRPTRPGEVSTPFYDLRAMRTGTELSLRVPRTGFFTTPAFFANWATNTSNLARVTMNQTLIVALGRSFDDSSNTLPLTTPGLDSKHASDAACAGCHVTLDPMRQVFRQAFTLTYHEQKDPAQVTLPGVFSFDGINKNISSPKDLALAMAQHPRFAVAWVQKLCYWANSAPCNEDDPEFVRIVDLFAQSGHQFKVLLRELLSSPLVTGLAQTRTFAENGVTISVARRDQLCASLSSRLGVPNLCALGRAPGLAQLVPSDGYTRGASAPILATDPSLFYRAATEQLCRSFADSAVDATVAGKPSRYASKQPEFALADMVQTVMGIVPSDPRSTVLRQILAEHFDKAKKTMGITATDAMKSTFVLACSAPPSVTIGL